MIITCPRCLATYNVPATALGAEGRNVRCTSCSFEWHEAPMPQVAIANLAPKATAPAPATPHHTPAPAVPRTAEATVKKPKASSVAAVKPKSTTPKATAVISLAVVATVLAGGLLLRNTISTMIPAMEGVYESIGLPVGSPAEWFRIDGKGVESAEDGDRFTLTVHGEINNISKRPRTLTPIRITWVGKDGQVGASTTVAPATERLAPGEKAGFVGILNRVDTSLGGEIRMVPWLGASNVVVKPSDQVEPNHLIAAPPHAATPAQNHGAAPAQTHNAEPAVAPVHEPAATAAPHTPAPEVTMPAVVPAPEAPSPAHEAEHEPEASPPPASEHPAHEQTVPATETGGHH